MAASGSDVVQVTVYGLSGEVTHSGPVAADMRVGELLASVRRTQRQGLGDTDRRADSVSGSFSLWLGLRKLDVVELVGSLEAVDPEQGIALNLVRGPSAVHFPFVAALVVGNQSYGDYMLRHSVSDAEKMRERLILLGWAPETVFFYKDVTTVELEAACVDFVERVSLLVQESRGPASSLIVAIFFVGHGYLRSGRFFMAPVDRPEGVSIEDYLLKGLNEAPRLRSKSKLICIACLDAGRGGPPQMTTGLEPWPPESDTIQTWRSPHANLLGSRHQFALLWASDPGRPAWETDQGGQFTKALLQHWNPDGLSVQEVFRRVTKEVRTATRETQRPWMETNATEEIYLPVPGVPEGPSAADLAPTAPGLHVEELRSKVAFLEDQLKLARESYQQLEQEKQRTDTEFQHMFRRLMDLEEENRSLQPAVQEHRKAMPPEGAGHLLVGSTVPGDQGSTRCIRSEDGMLELEIPPDAASEAVIDQIRIQTVAGELLEQLGQGLEGDACSAMYSLEPHGQLFHRPVALHLRLTSSGACADAAGTCVDAHGAAIFRREHGGTEWEPLLQSWADEGSTASACMHSFCYVVLRCCKPRVSIAEYLLDGALKVWIALHPGKLKAEDYTHPTCIGYKWSCLGDCQWQQLLKNGTSYCVQVHIGHHEIFSRSMEWLHFGGPLQFGIDIELTALPPGIRDLSIMCNGGHQMSFKLESLKPYHAAPLAVPAPWSLEPSPELVHPGAADSPQPIGTSSPEVVGAAAGASVPEAAEGMAQLAPPVAEVVSPVVRSEQLAALIVGNSAYMPASGRKELQQGASDARRMHEKLRKLGWPPERLLLCCDLSLSAFQATCASFVNLLQQEVVAQESAGSTDRHIVFIFFAGHAYERLGHFFMCAVDLFDGVSIEDRLLGPLNRIDCKTTLKIISCFDACRDAEGPPVPTTPAFDGLRLPEMQEVDDRETWRRIRAMRYSRHQFLMLWACDPGREALEAGKKQGGILTTALLKHLDGSSVQEAFQNVADEVRTYTWNKQRPWMETNATKPVHL